ncbi:unnamed protein product [Cylindrotheca closterium]|uniref:Uncharacterized protein n=1 Tax=Cylindrotheca closterium TaxID=2856 RepID=A0AAD2CL23_9STRA|nr:unnamed protein product [Cylindrotheca closterium]
MRAAQCPAFWLPKNTGKRLTGWLVRARVMALLNKESKYWRLLQNSFFSICAFASSRWNVIADIPIVASLVNDSSGRH